MRERTSVNRYAMGVGADFQGHQLCCKQLQMFGVQGGKVTQLLGMLQFLTECTTRAGTALHHTNIRDL